MRNRGTVSLLVALYDVAMTSEFLLVAEQLFEAVREPMTPRELVDRAYGQKLFSDKIAGKTPHQTMKSKLSVHIRRWGQQSRFVRTDPGRFYLRRLLEPGSPLHDARPIQPPKTAERVLVFPAEWLNTRGRFQGIQLPWKKVHHDLLRSTVCHYEDRYTAEQDDLHKQILTYVMVTNRGRILSYKRGTYNRVADFLRGAHCIGFGGHVVEADLNLFSRADLGLRQSAARELAEELKLPHQDKARLVIGEGLEIVGVLNDDSSEVGRRHFAFVFRYEANDGWTLPERGEKAITQLRWLDINSSEFSLSSYEYWSQLCLREYFANAVKAQPSCRIRRRAPLRPPHLLCVLGPVGSGKSEATNLLKADFGYVEINSGQVLAELLNVPPVPVTSREAFQRMAWQFIQTPEGPATLATALWERAVGIGHERVLIDGIRQSRTLDVLRRLAGHCRPGLLYVHTPPDVAFAFYRSRSDAPLDIFGFLRVRDALVEKDVEGMIAQSDAVLYNWTGKALYRRTIRAMMRELRVNQE